jgi:hypothetical protein
MLLFKPYHVKLIQDGIKTQTRRIWKKPRCKVGSVHKAKTKMLSKEYFADLYIIDVHKEHLLDISEKDAWCEGGYTRDQFLNIWDEINPLHPSRSNPEVYVITFNQTQESIRRTVE